ncbi:hypothetical protein [Pseudoruegeria sp. SK021]|uniref:hypothetical protein n=1 Tax=Pseudoruegeria sp. SK021 TaxID=1933035 RepID=UPI00143D73A8|nr:hypothetical protein [Pseudoruegeria sp. SK021]
MIKVVSLFLIGMVALAMFGRLRMPGAAKLKALKCSRCGKYRIGKSKCDCGRKTL